MKTIEERAKEKSQMSLGGGRYYTYPGEKAFVEGFKSGAEFAQSWIRVEDELHIEQGYYLVVAPHSFPKNCNVVVAEFYEDNKTFYSESSDSPIEDATHWRPIDRK